MTLPDTTRSPRPSRPLSHDERYRVLTESAPDAIITIDDKSVILSVNPATERTFGWPADELIGQHLTVLMPPRMRPLHEGGMKRYLQTGRPHLDWRGVAVPGLRRNGTEFPMEVSFGEFVDGESHIFSGFMRDVSDRAAQQLLIDETTTDLKHAMEALEERVLESEEARRLADEANRAKGEFLRTMSHELRTPLNAIGGYVDLIEAGVRGAVSDAQREDLGRIRSAQGRLLALINDALNLTKLQQGLVPFDIRSVCVSDVLCALAPMIEPQLRAKHITFECKADTGEMRVKADEQKLDQILLNLLSNAVKFTPDGGRVDVSANLADERVHITIRDNGPGIPRSRLTAVFEPFVQVDSTLTRLHEGTGLGLSISRELAHAMGGRITVDSVLGKGAAFTVSLPASMATSQPAPG